MKRFLVGIDGFERSDAAIHQALELAHSLGAQVTFVRPGRHQKAA